MICTWFRFLFCPINLLWPSDAKWHWGSWSTLVQAFAWCLTAPSHYLNQSWLGINEILWHSFQGNIYMSTQDIKPQVVLEMYTFEITATFPREQWVKAPCGCSVAPTSYRSQICETSYANFPTTIVTKITLNNSLIQIISISAPPLIWQKNLTSRNVRKCGNGYMISAL